MIKSRIMQWIVVLLLGYVLLIALVMWREPGLVYYPSQELGPSPKMVGLEFEDIWLDAEDGVRLHGWFIPSPRPLPAGNRVTWLFFHGNAGNISHRHEKVGILTGLGSDVYIIDYRGYGKSEGAPSEQGLYRDARAAYRHLTERRKLSPSQIMLYGESLGSGVAVQLASEVSVGGVVIEEAFTSVMDVGRKMFPYLPVRWMVRNRYDSVSKIGKVSAPVLILHSRQDEVFDFSHAERLFQSAREPKRLVELRGGHNDAFLQSMDTYRAALAGFQSNRR